MFVVIFVNVMDINLLVVELQLIILVECVVFDVGFIVFMCLIDGKVYVCQFSGGKLGGYFFGQVCFNQFSGLYLVGLLGMYIYFLELVSLNKQVWYFNYQDVIVIGKFFFDGEFYCEWIIVFGGLQVIFLWLVKMMFGVSLEDLLVGELQEGENRVIFGLVFSGVCVYGFYVFLGCFYLQVSVVKEGWEKEFFGWVMLGKEKFLIICIMLGYFFKCKCFYFFIDINGGEWVMVLIGNYEWVMFLDILLIILLCDLLVGDIDSVQVLGCLELDEEDLVLCIYVCSGKYEYGLVLCSVLIWIEQEG